MDAPENARNAVIDHQNYKNFLGEDPQTLYLLYKTPTCWGRGAGVKEIRVGEANILCCLKCKVVI